MIPTCRSYARDYLRRRLPANWINGFSTAAAEEANIQRETKTVTVTDGRSVTISTESYSFPLHASWLWVNDPSRIHPTSGQRTTSLGQFSSKNRILDASIESHSEGRQRLPISPPGCFHSRGGVYEQTRKVQVRSKEESSHLRVRWATGEESLYDMDWLRRFASSPSSSPQTRSTKITKELAIGAQGNPLAVPIPRFVHDDFHSSDSEQTVYQALDAIVRHGAILISGAPTTDGHNPVTALGKLLSGGTLSHGSLYGDFFHVESVPNANNIAYTSEALPPHQDLTYYESKPFLQLLHCIHDLSLIHI